MLVLIHMVQLRSFGFPYLQPLAPLKKRELYDVVIRAPRWRMMLQPLFREAAQRKNEDGVPSFWDAFFHRSVQPLTERGDDSRGQQ